MSRLIFLICCEIFLKSTLFAQLNDFAAEVDPFIGTDYHGHVFLGANVPFGGMQLGPSQIPRGWDWCSGYHYSGKEILGFTHTHLSGTGIGDWNDVLLLPASGEERLMCARKDDLSDGYGSSYSHDKEHCSPGYYDVHLDRYNVDVRLSTTDKAGIHEYTFHDQKNPHVILDMSFHILWNTPVESEIHWVNDSTILGYSFTKGWASDQRVFVAIRLNRPARSYALYQGDEQVNSSHSTGTNTKTIIYPQLSASGKMWIKVGLSAVSEKNALENLDTEIPHWDFDLVKNNARQVWNNELSRVKINAPKKILRKYYTAMYHSWFFPNTFQDIDGSYRAANMQIKKDSKTKNYTLYSLWDTYRALHPWLTITQPEKVRDIVVTMLHIYQDQGKLPVWHLSANETNTMIGLPAIPVVADAYEKGLIDGYEDLAYEAVIHSAKGVEEGLFYPNQMRFIPADSVNEATAKGLEYAIADAATARLASIRGNKSDAPYFAKRADLYKQYFDTKTGYMRGRMADGSFRAPFDPFQSKHRQNDYCEGNAWQYTWLVPQDPHGLIKLFGGQKAFNAKLDTFFTAKGDLGPEASADISGLIGQYAHGNEPNHHIIYLYNFSGQQWKAAALAREVMDTFYTDKPDGLCGNEDAGQMSAWYTFSALGFYPVNPSNGIYIIGSPEINTASIHLPNGKYFKIEAVNNSAKNIYIQKIEWNGALYNKSFISHKMIMGGGTLKYYMGDHPNKKFGSALKNRPK